MVPNLQSDFLNYERSTKTTPSDKNLPAVKVPRHDIRAQTSGNFYIREKKVIRDISKTI